MNKIYSHPPTTSKPEGKELLTHLRGVYDICIANMQHLQDDVLTGYTRKDYAIASVYVCFWHDMGKLNPIFQKYLLDEDFQKHIISLGYSCPPEYYKNHALVSAYGFLIWLYSAMNNGTADELPMHRIISILNVINRHHGNLRSRGISVDSSWRLFTAGEDVKLMEFLEKFPMNYVGDFYKQIPELSVNKEFSVENNEGFMTFINPKDEETVDHATRGDYYLPVLNHKNSSTLETVYENVQEFYFQQWLFAALCEADKRDASYNNVYTLAESLCNTQKVLVDGLTSFQERIALNATKTPFSGMKVQLNSVRTTMQEEAVLALNSYSSNERVFSLTAPTGSGKTIMLLRLAESLQKLHPELSILYCLPFLSITDQVSKILEDDIKLNVLTVTSLAETKKDRKKLKVLDNDEVSVTTSDKIEDDKTTVTSWTSLTFDHPFIVTTFVQLFETLLSNKNRKLLKLVNLKNRIFLIDEVQALPQNQYPFFVAMLREFCYLHNCYAVLSTATMPDFTLYSPNVKINSKQSAVYDVEHIFPTYKKPIELLDSIAYFNNPVFNRYKISFNTGIDNHNRLGYVLSNAKDNTLAICNTIAESRKTFEAMSLFPSEINGKSCYKYLLNTRFTPEHRRSIITEVRTKMQNGVVVLVSTSIVEAGVDLDFYRVYRDLCPWSNLIQAAGRTNRNYLYQYGEVVVLEMKVVDDMNMDNEDSVNVSVKEKAESYIHGFIYASVYTDEVKKYLVANPTCYEKDLYTEQKRHFENICQKLSLGKYSYRTETNTPATGNLVKELVELDVEKLGNFSLINSGDGKHELTYFVSRFGSVDDMLWKQWCDLWQVCLLADGRIDYHYRKQINELHKKIVQKCVTIRFKIDKDGKPTKRIPKYDGDEIGGIVLLKHASDYQEETGLNFI